MNNFEKRMYLDYLEKLAPYMNLKGYEFDEVLDTFIFMFNINRNIFKFDDDGVVLTATRTQQNDLIKSLKSAIAKTKAKIPVRKTKFEEKLLLIKDIYKMNDKEYQAFTYLVLQEVNHLFSDLNSAINGGGFDKFAKVYLKVRCREKDRIVNNLFLSKLISSKSYSPSINDDLIKVFDDESCNTPKKMVDTLLGKPEKSTLTLKDYSHMEKETNKVISILKSAVKKKTKGINILLYGDCGTGKSELSKLIPNVCKIPVYIVITENKNGIEAKREERLADLNSKQQILSKTGNACLLFDEAEDILNRGWLDNGTASKGYLNKLLENVGCPVIYTTNNISQVDPAFLRRMTYAVEFSELDESARLNIWNKVVRKNKLKVSKIKIKELSENYDVSPSIIANAVETTKMIDGNENDFEDFIESVAKVVQKKRDVKEEKKEETPLGNYDIRLVNADMDMEDLTEKIKQSSKMNFSLCLYGPPGSSKSSYIRYLAKQLGCEVLFKRASDLISPYVGQTEINIAECFKQAHEEHKFLIFDEADSFLMDRSNAVRSFEYSMVNEMLTQMETADFPFACTTNLIDCLDEACKRRFTFKLKMDFLKPQQANLAMETFFEIKNANLNIQGLTAGDFATVKKKCDFLNITDVHTISKMLQEEVHLKKIPELKKNTIGF
ncbi:ATP-binding protein [bacterium]|nr:ATP-binding protein [bacterium]